MAIVVGSTAGATLTLAINGIIAALDAVGSEAEQATNGVRVETNGNTADRLDIEIYKTDNALSNIHVVCIRRLAKQAITGAMLMLRRIGIDVVSQRMNVQKRVLHMTGVIQVTRRKLTCVSVQSRKIPCPGYMQANIVKATLHRRNNAFYL